MKKIRLFGFVLIGIFFLSSCIPAKLQPTQTPKPLLHATTTPIPSPTSVATVQLTATPDLSFGIDKPTSTSSYDIRFLSIEKVDEYVLPDNGYGPQKLTASEGLSLFVIRTESSYGFTKIQSWSGKETGEAFTTSSNGINQHFFVVVSDLASDPLTTLSYDILAFAPIGTTLTSFHLPENVVIDLTSLTK